MTPKTIPFAGAAVAAVLSLAAVGPAAAQTYPDRPVTLVVPFAAGGPTDIVARMMSVPMSKSLGQQVTVENTVGAGGTIAATRVARSKPDGYTLFIHHMGMSTAPALYRKLSFDPMNDFEYVGQVVDVPMTLLARKDFPANTLPELLAYIRANKDKVTLANAGLGAVSHLCGLLFQSAIGVDMVTVPYKGTGPAMTDLMGGQVDLLCDQTTQTVPLIKEGRVKVWHGLYAPKGTPAPVLEKVNAALRAAMDDPTVKQRMLDLSADIVPADKMTAAGLKTFLESEIAKWGPVIKKAGVFAD